MSSAKSPEVRLQHILDQIDGIMAATQGRDFAEVQGNFLYERAVERTVQIISEAAKELPADLRNRYPDVTGTPSSGSATCSGTNTIGSGRGTCGKSRLSISRNSIL